MGCFDRLNERKLGKERIAEINTYIEEASSHKNPHNLRFDEKWVKYLYEGTRVSWFKLIFLFICILPSFSKCIVFGPVSLTIQGCVLRNASTKVFIENLRLSECFKLNQESLTLKIPLSSMNFQELRYLFFSQLCVIMPQIAFFAYFSLSREQRKAALWLRGARIALTSSDKRWATFKDWMLIIILALMTLLSNYRAFQIGSGITFLHSKALPTIAYKNNLVFFTFEAPTYMKLAISYVTSFMAYSCLLVTYKNFVQEPMVYFYGFRKYFKKSAKVAYNIDAVDYRVEMDLIITYFYQQCKKHDCYVVLKACVSYLMDKDRLISHSDKKKKAT